MQANSPASNFGQSSGLSMFYNAGDLRYTPLFMIALAQRTKDFLLRGKERSFITSLAR